MYIAAVFRDCRFLKTIKTKNKNKMNRVVKFRGRCIKSGDWVYGDLIHGVGAKSGNLYILPNKINLASVKHCGPLDGVKVIPETVGQFTGLFDKNGKEIYEGDIVKHDAWDYPFEVIFNQEKTRFVCKMKTGLTQYINNDEIEVIGNIYENPELITK